MKSVDRPFLLGLLLGFFACTLSVSVDPTCLLADERDEEEIVEYESVFETEGPPTREQSERTRERRERRMEPEDERDDVEPETRQRMLRQLREHQERMLQQMRESMERNRERHEREIRDPEMRERELREREMHEREMREREMRERENREREMMHRRQMEERERSEHEHRLNMESRELEIRQQQLELRAAEIELEKRERELNSHQDDVAIDAIELATSYMEPPAAAEFLADLLDDTRSPRVRTQLRLQLARMLFRTDRPDEAAEQLRAVIAP